MERESIVLVDALSSAVAVPLIKAINAAAERAALALDRAIWLGTAPPECPDRICETDDLCWDDDWL